jgi:hypothetical protein
MIGLNWRTLAAVAMSSSAILAITAGAAQANDEGRWERERWERHHHYAPEYRRAYDQAPRVVYERAPVVIMPAPVYQAPVYAQPVDPSLNLNFTIPLR